MLRVKLTRYFANCPQITQIYADKTGNEFCIIKEGKFECFLVLLLNRGRVVAVLCFNLRQSV